MGKIADTILEIQQRENIALPELFEKYPHLAKLQYEEQLLEQNVNENKKELLCD